MWSIGETSSFRVEALHCLVDIDFSPGDLLHQLDSTGGRGRGAVDPDLYEQRVEPGPRRRVADAEVSLELFHIPARCEKDAKDVAVLVRQDAELARRECPRQLDHARDGADRAVALERAGARSDGHLPVAGRLHVFERDLAHRGVRPDPDTRALVEYDAYLSHLAADRARAAVEAALRGDVSGRHLEVDRSPKVRDVAIACLDFCGDGALHPMDGKVPSLGLRHQRQGRVHTARQVAADVDARDSDPTFRAAELEAWFIAQHRLLDDHRVAFFVRLVWPFGDRVADAGVSDDLGVSKAIDHPDLLDAGPAIRGGRRCGWSGGFGVERFQACGSFLGGQCSGGNLAQDFALEVFHASN